MTLTQLKYIVETAKAGTISRAAEKLYISQPSLTAAFGNWSMSLALPSSRGPTREFC